MGLEIVDRTTLKAEVVQALGVGSSRTTLSSVEAVAASIRRAAGFLCPCPPAALRWAVLETYRGLIDAEDQIPDRVEETLGALVAYGDLLELDVQEDEAASRGRMLSLAAPAFVPLTKGTVLLVGLVPDSVSVLPAGLESRVEHVRHQRRLSVRPGEDLRSELRQFGLMEMSSGIWMKAPDRELPVDHKTRLDRLLDRAPRAGEISGLSVLEPSSSVGYYRARWTSPGSRTGRFVARRPRAYGSEVWCYVELIDGNPHRLLDLPVSGSRDRGCDEAWRLQAAVDAVRGAPQRFKINESQNGWTLDLFSPVPMWAQRRWDCIGEPVSSSRGALCSYLIDAGNVADEVQFATDQLWLAEERER